LKLSHLLFIKSLQKILLLLLANLDFTIDMWGHPHVMIFSVFRFASQLSVLCLNTHPYTDPDNSCLTIMAFSVLRISSQWDHLSLHSDSRSVLDLNYFTVTHQSNSPSRSNASICSAL